MFEQTTLIKKIYERSYKGFDIILWLNLYGSWWSLCLRELLMITKKEVAIHSGSVQDCVVIVSLICETMFEACVHVSYIQQWIPSLFA